MKNNIKKILMLISIVFSLSGCCFVTLYKDYEIYQSCCYRILKDDSILVYVPISGTETTKTLFPLIIDTNIRKEPYKCHFTILGHFKEVKVAVAAFILNGQQLPPLPLNIKKMNDEKKMGNVAEQFLFPAGKFALPFIWEHIESLEMEIHFIAIDINGNEVEYKERKIFKKRLYKRKANRTWDTMMSV